MQTSWVEVDVAVLVGVLVAAAPVGVGVREGVLVGDGPEVGVLLGVLVGAGVLVLVGVGEGPAVLVRVGVRVAVGTALTLSDTTQVPQPGNSKVRVAWKKPTMLALLKSASHQSALPPPANDREGTPTVVGELEEFPGQYSLPFQVALL